MLKFEGKRLAHVIFKQACLAFTVQMTCLIVCNVKNKIYTRTIEAAPNYGNLFPPQNKSKRYLRLLCSRL